MKKRSLKVIAATTTAALLLGLMPIPALAESTNIVAETEGVTSLTVGQIKSLAVIYNPTNATYDLNQKMLELNMQMNRNSISSARSSLREEFPDSSEIDRLAKEILEAEEAGNDTTELQKQYNEAYSKYQQQYSSYESKANSTISQIEQLEKNSESYDREQTALDKSVKDWEIQVKMIAEVLCMSLLKADQNIAIQEKNIALSEKSLNLAKVQQELGMTLSVDVQSTETSLAESKAQLESAKENRNTIKRKINVLIGRSWDADLSIADYTPAMVVNSVPTYSAEIAQQVINNDVTLQKYDQSIQDTKDSVEGVTASDTLQKADYSIEQVKLNIEDRKRTIVNSIKSKLATMNSDYAAYQTSMQKVVTARKNLEIAQTKYDLGMITKSQLTQSEISLQNAQLTHWTNQCTYYLDWFEYNCMLNGTDTSTYSQYKL